MPLPACFTAVITAWLITPSYGALPPRGQPLLNASRMEHIVHFGLFPDKPRDMSYLNYFKNLTGLEESDFDPEFTNALERLEFGVLDFENLEIAVKLAEDAKRLRETRVPLDARRQAVTPRLTNDIFSYAKYQNSTVFQMGVVYGNSLELRTTAANLFTTLARMPPSVTMLWYVFHYHKLLNMAYDINSNTEFMHVLNDRLKQGFHHLKGMTGTIFEGYSMPIDEEHETSLDPENLYRRKIYKNKSKNKE